MIRLAHRFLVDLHALHGIYMFRSFCCFSSAVDLRGPRRLLTSQHSLPGIPVALKQSIDLRTSMDGKYKEIAEVRAQSLYFLFLRNVCFIHLWLHTLSHGCLFLGAVLPQPDRQRNEERSL